MVVKLSTCIVKTSMQLGLQFVLTPERYNPKRRMNLSDEKEGVLLSEIVTLENEIITVKKSSSSQWYPINTSDAMGGYLSIPPKADVLKSNKKVLKCGDVIISRLRPYLRQIAYVDKEDINLCASTEFYVLRARNRENLAFLVPFLLSEAVQTVLENSVEGSQHPRFKEQDIMNLIIPSKFIEEREKISQHIRKAIAHYRAYEEDLNAEISYINGLVRG